MKGRRESAMNDETKNVFLNILRAAIGLFISAFGTYLTIRANIGVGPWDALNLGLSGTFGVTFGTASITIGLMIVALDLLLREPVGIGMLLDAVLIGKFVDLFDRLELIPLQKGFLPGLLTMTGGILVIGLAQTLYMGAGLGCGPRDGLMVAMGKRFRRTPIGIVYLFVLTAATLAGWLLGGPIGVGTLYFAFFGGPLIQATYRLTRFDPTAIVHQDLLTSCRVLAGQKLRS